MKRKIILFTLGILCAAGVAWAERLSVATSMANIRSGPGTQYEIMWKVEKYHPLEIIEKSGAWYFFRDFEDDEGWIHKSLLKAIPAVITNASKCNIRSGPGIKFDILFVLEKGIPFQVLDRKKNWMHVQHADGDKGWIHQSLVW